MRAGRRAGRQAGRQAGGQAGRRAAKAPHRDDVDRHVAGQPHSVVVCSCSSAGTAPATAAASPPRRRASQGASAVLLLVQPLLLLRFGEQHELLRQGPQELQGHTQRDPSQVGLPATPQEAAGGLVTQHKPGGQWSLTLRCAHPCRRRRRCRRRSCDGCFRLR